VQLGGHRLEPYNLFSGGKDLSEKLDEKAIGHSTKTQLAKAEEH
jgi:hypothetical protein